MLWSFGALLKLEFVLGESTQLNLPTTFLSMPVGRPKCP